MNSIVYQLNRHKVSIFFVSFTAITILADYSKTQAAKKAKLIENQSNKHFFIF